MTSRRHLHLVPIDPPAIVRPATLEPGALFWWWGRPLKVVRVLGQDAGAPVIVEELQAGPDWAPGQMALWSVDFVQQAMASRHPRMKGVSLFSTTK